jgi:hypothetical protein
VIIFGGFLEMFEKLRPTMVVADSYLRRLLPTMRRLGGATSLRLRDLKAVSEVRRNNGLRKKDENGVKVLRGMFYVAKHTRTTTNDPLANEIHKILRRYTEGLATRIHEKAIELPLYWMAVERLGLKDPLLAYIISRDTIVFKTLSRTGLERRYELFRHPWRGRGLRSQLLIRLAYATVTHRNQRYLAVYESYRQRGKRQWQAILRVAKRILRDIRRLAMEAQEAELTAPA